MNNLLDIVSIFFGILMGIIIGMTIALFPAILAALFFEWGFCRWKQKRFSGKRYLTILITCFAIRLLLPYSGSENLGTDILPRLKPRGSEV